MKITILKNKLKEGIGAVERVSSKSLTLPMLDNVLVTAEKNFLNLSATDLEVGINWWALVKTEQEGKIAVPSRVLSNFVNFLPNKPVNLSKEKLSLQVSCENYQTSIKGFGPDDFPIIPSASREENISIKSKLFCQGLKKVVDIAGGSSVKPEISGVYFLFQKNLITMAATDSIRLGEKQITFNSSFPNISKDYSLILPQRAAKEVISIFEEKEGDLIIYFSPNQILFETQLTETAHPQLQLTSRLIEGEYPNYQEIIPKKFETRISVASAELINQIKAASLFSGKSNEVRLKVDSQKKQIDIFSKDADTGEHHSFLPCKIEGKACEISFNHKFLLDGLLGLSLDKEKSPEATLEFIGPDKPGVLRIKGDNSYLYLVMPIKAT